jgi:hypothetical protein
VPAERVRSSAKWPRIGAAARRRVSLSVQKAEEASTAGAKRAVTMEKLVNLCKRRGIVFPASEIYGGLGSTWDYGPLGIELKRNVKEAWWRAMVTTRSDVVGLDSAILQHPRTWEASGHLQNFTDPLVDCKSCKQRFRADHVQGNQCPECGGELTEARSFNLMFKTFMGPVEDSANVVYLRPETAQGIFLNFANIVDTQRVKLPFGVAQTGKSFRNEITPGNFIFRTREFEQMEMEFFVKPDPAEEARWFDYWVEERFNWYVNYGVRREHLKLRPHEKDELSHYSRGTTDVEYLYPFGWGELEGIAKRGRPPAWIARCSRLCSTRTTKTWSRTKNGSCSVSIRASRRSRPRSIRCCVRAGSLRRRKRCCGCSSGISRPPTIKPVRSDGVIAARTKWARRLVSRSIIRRWKTTR